MKKRIFILTGVTIVIAFVIAILYFGKGEKGEGVCDTTTLVGVYEGEATLDIPEKIRSMAKDANGNSLIPDGPIPCKVAIGTDGEGKVGLELVGFKMPVEGVEMKAIPCSVTLLDGAFRLAGDGKVDYGGQKFSYSHKGKMKDEELELSATLTIIPFVIEPKVIFKGRRMIQ